VPHEDATSIEAALRLLITNPERAARASAVAVRQAASLTWANVAADYRRLISAVSYEPVLASR